MLSSKVTELIRQIGLEFDTINAIFLFGSYARGEQRAGNDIDLGVLVRKQLATEDILKINARFADIHEPRIDVALLDGSDLFLTQRSR
jgi:predicted nucleotidyltransferase